MKLLFSSFFITVAHATTQQIQQAYKSAYEELVANHPETLKQLEGVPKSQVLASGYRI